MRSFVASADFGGATNQTATMPATARKSTAAPATFGQLRRRAGGAVSFRSIQSERRSFVLPASIAMLLGASVLKRSRRERPTAPTDVRGDGGAHQR